jgi:hypothetical protein
MVAKPLDIENLLDKLFFFDAFVQYGENVSEGERVESDGSSVKERVSLTEIKDLEMLPSRLVDENILRLPTLDKFLITTLLCVFGRSVCTGCSVSKSSVPKERVDSSNRFKVLLSRNSNHGLLEHDASSRHESGDKVIPSIE